ncbi:MAG: restriction endonuclease subunit S [Armatimonadaceae bacterium]
MEHQEGGRVGEHCKDAGMKAGWEFKTLGDVCEIINGGTPKTNTPEFWDGEHQWITPAEMGKRMSPYVSQTLRTLTSVGLRNSSARLIPEQSVILSTRAPIGHLVINTVPMATNQGCRGLVPSARLITRYLYYFLTHNVDLLNDLGTGTTFKELAAGKLKEIPIPLPPLAEQQRIVAILDEAFEGIATARANAVKNHENARALFESHLEAVFSKRGEGWVEKRLEEVCNLLPGYAFKSADYINASKTLNIRMSNIRPGGSFDSEHNQKFLPDSYAKKYSAYSLYEGDLIIAMTDMAGDPKILGVPTLVRNLNGRNFLMNQRVGKLFDFTPDVCQRYLRYFLTSPSVKKYYKTKGAGGLQINISKGDILSVVVPLPNVEHQDCVTQQLDALREETNHLTDIYTQKIAALDALKKSLLHQAFSGAL